MDSLSLCRLNSNWSLANLSASAVSLCLNCSTCYFLSSIFSLHTALLIYKNVEVENISASSYTVIRYKGCTLHNYTSRGHHLYCSGTLWVGFGSISGSLLPFPSSMPDTSLSSYRHKKMILKNNFGPWWGAKCVKECQIHTLNLLSLDSVKHCHCSLLT